MSRRTDGSSPSSGLRVATGTYTGDGAATQAITGVGFQPKFVSIYAQQAIFDSEVPWALKTNVDGINSSVLWTGGVQHRYEPNHIISLDADGFTVGNAAGFFANLLNGVDKLYSYTCFR